MTIALALVVGAAVGALLGLLGGSILAVPALVYVLGLGVEQAIPLSLAVTAVASVTGVLPRARASGRFSGGWRGCSPRWAFRVRLLAA